jgi:alpha-beta hydrolase superfamily lysophospholipase
LLKRLIRWCRVHWKLTAASILISLLIAANAVAYMHAHAMTHFTVSGTRTANPEELSALQKVKVILTGITVLRPTNERTPAAFALPFEVHSLKSADGTLLEGWTIHHSRPKGVVVLFHGYSAAKSALLPEACAFHELGYQTFLLDFRGSGGSGGNETTIGVKEAEDVAAAWEFARTRWPNLPVALFGQSMGSAACLRAIAFHSVSPDALVVECPFDRLLSTVENRFASMGLPSFPFAQMLIFWGGVQHGFNGFKHDPVKYAESISCPVLLLHGADDPRVTRAQAQAVFAGLAGSKRLYEFQSVGHRSYLSAQPQTWRDEVGEFLGQHLAAPR